MRGGAQIWLADCGKRLSDVGHHITFILPEVQPYVGTDERKGHEGTLLAFDYKID